MSNTTYKYATEFSTEHSLAQAYKEFYDHAVANYQVLIAMTQDAVDLTSTDVHPSEIASRIIRENSQYDITDKTLVATNEGVIYLKDLLTNISSGVKEQLNHIDGGELSSLDFTMSIPRIQDSVLSIKISQLFDEFNSTLHAITVEQAVGLAFACGTTIAEKVALARDAVASIFSSAFTDFSSCLRDAIDCIKNGFTLSQYITRRLKRSGMEAMAQFETPITSSEDVEYSGASIWGGVMWQTTNNYVVDTLVNTGKAIAAAGVTLFNWIKTGATWVLNKFWGWEGHTFINPIDVEVINKDGNHTTDLFAMEGHLAFDSRWINSAMIKKLLEGPIHCDFIPCEIIITLNPDVYSNAVERWSTIVGRLKIIAEAREYADPYNDSLGLLGNLNHWMGSSYTNIQIAMMYFCNKDPHEYENYPDLMELLEDEIDSGGGWNPNIGSIYVKIKPINSTYMWHFLNDYNAITTTNAIEVMEQMIQYQDMYSPGPTLTDVAVLQDATEEHNTYMDFVSGAFFTKCLLNILYHEATGGGSSYIVYKQQFQDGLSNLVSNPLADWPTNASFLSVLVDGKLKVGSVQYYDFSLQGDIYDFSRVLYNVLKQQEENPFNMEFFPYTHNEVSWYKPMYRIKTDTEHQVELANFLVKAVAVVITVVVTIVVVKKIRTKAVTATLQAEGALWSATEAASKGELTTDLVKAYRKAALKAKIINFISGNLLAASGKAGSSLIQGTGALQDVSESYISEITANTDDGVASIRRLIKR